MTPKVRAAIAMKKLGSPKTHASGDTVVNIEDRYSAGGYLASCRNGHSAGAWQATRMTA
jgi:hypothetical protein